MSSTPSRRSFVTNANAVDTLRGVHKKTTMDLKERYDIENDATKFEIAKDMCAFANALGGTILVGAIEGRDDAGRKNGRIQQLKGVEAAIKLVKLATKANSELCRPLLVFEHAEIVLDVAQQVAIIERQPSGGTITVVALNVHPLVNGPAGCHPFGSNGAKIADAYRFPVRTGEGTRFLVPEELSFHMNSHERRMYLLLTQVPDKHPIKLWDHERSLELSPASYEILKVDGENMTLTVMNLHKHVDAEIPLMFVRAVWKTSAGWNVAVQGTVCKSSHANFVPAAGV